VKRSDDSALLIECRVQTVGVGSRRAAVYALTPSNPPIPILIKPFFEVPGDIFVAPSLSKCPKWTIASA
jgi:hypothetical protein